jgi:hypothetical protein
LPSDFPAAKETRLGPDSEDLAAFASAGLFAFAGVDALVLPALVLLAGMLAETAFVFVLTVAVFPPQAIANKPIEHTNSIFIKAFLLNFC